MFRETVKALDLVYPKILLGSRKLMLDDGWTDHGPRKVFLSQFQQKANLTSKTQDGVKQNWKTIEKRFLCEIESIWDFQDDF